MRPASAGETRRGGDALERDARRHRRVDRHGDRVKRAGVEHAAARCDLHSWPDVADPCEVGLGGLLEDCDRFGGQCLTSGDLVGIGRGTEGEGLQPSRLAPRDRGEPIEDLGQLQQLEGPRIHRASVGRPPREPASTLGVREG